MEGHYFAFPTIAELIVRKNFTRKQYETLIKLLVSVKNAYLEQRKMEAAEAEELLDEQQKKDQAHITKPDENVITDEDLIDMQLLDDFLTQHQRSFDQKKALWNMFIQKAKDEQKEKLDQLKEQNSVGAKQQKLIE